MTALDLSGVTPEIPADLAELVRQIEGSGSCSSRIRRAGRRGARRIGRVATSLQRLDAGVALIGARATLELIGRTDPTGSDSANQALSRERAEAVVAALAARGVPTGAAPRERRRHQPPADRGQLRTSGPASTVASHSG